MSELKLRSLKKNRQPEKWIPLLAGQRFKTERGEKVARSGRDHSVGERMKKTGAEAACAKPALITGQVELDICQNATSTSRFVARRVSLELAFNGSMRLRPLRAGSSLCLLRRCQNAIAGGSWSGIPLR